MLLSPCSAEGGPLVMGCSDHVMLWWCAAAWCGNALVICWWLCEVVCLQSGGTEFRWCGAVIVWGPQWWLAGWLVGLLVGWLVGRTLFVLIRIKP